MGLTQQQLVDLVSAFGPSILSGIGQAGQAGADRALLEQDRQRQIEQEQYNRRLGARGALAGFYQNQQTRDINAANAFADQSPLGAEQIFAQQMARRRMVPALAAQFQNQTGGSPMATAALRNAPNFLAPFAGSDYQSTVSQGATARSIAERRKALAGVDPNFQFGSMGDYGLPDLGGEVSQYQGDVRSRRQASELELQRLLTEQMREASAAQIPGATQGTTAAGTGAAASSKKPSLLKRIANVALTAAPIVAAPFTGGTSLALIGAGAGAAKGLLNGGGAQGALTGGITGAASSALLGGAPRVGGEAASAAVKRAILNPRALAQLTGSAVGGQAGDALTMASASLPGAKQGPRGLALKNAMTARSLPTGPGPAALQRAELGLPEGMLPGGGALSTDIGAPPPAPKRRRGGAAPAAPAATTFKAVMGTTPPPRFFDTFRPGLSPAAPPPAQTGGAQAPAAPPPPAAASRPGPFGPIADNPQMKSWQDTGILDRWIAAFMSGDGWRGLNAVDPKLLPLMAMGYLPPTPPASIDQFIRRTR